MKPQFNIFKKTLKHASPMDFKLAIQYNLYVIETCTLKYNVAWWLIYWWIIGTLMQFSFAVYGSNFLMFS